jgi:hypothetical protein
VEDVPRGALGRTGGADFFTVEVLTVAGLIRYVVLFVMKLKTRIVEIVGISSQPDAHWMTQVARNLTDADDDGSSAAWTASFSTEPLHRSLPGSAAGWRRGALALARPESKFKRFAERFVGSVKSEGSNRIVPLGEDHLRGAIRAFMALYHEERRHEGLQNKLIAPATAVSEPARSDVVSASAGCSSSMTARPRNALDRV